MYKNKARVCNIEELSCPNSSQRAVSGLSGASCRRMRTSTIAPDLPAAPFPPEGAPVVVAGCPLGALVASVTVGFIVPNRKEAEGARQAAASDTRFENEGAPELLAPGPVVRLD